MDPEIGQWRRAQRKALLARRREMPLEERQTATRIVASKLDAIIAANGCATIGLFWPINHEMNFLSWGEDLSRQGKILCLPVVVTPKEPLEYWRWKQGDPLGRGIWDIPVPAHRHLVTPDLMLAPMVGFDRANYRLGYGGGYFDRTLAAMRPRPMVVGVGFEFSALETIFPQPHDIPMDAVVTEHLETPPGDRSNHAV
jgi:5-formyltetrahydrofolate cyclo-ligase